MVTFSDTCVGCFAASGPPATILRSGHRRCSTSSLGGIASSPPATAIVGCCE
eukprot:NODE_21684_length_741_cov_3.815961.p4 GENE.NODE_21684_length_741_cov_3.815961~~NODE_21684_length_741_cov_3.815961.p4  ORF type:complete len:52 (+),score=4.06 NODE_21684_length_741_cov_3.815961:186-341(+)